MSGQEDDRRGHILCGANPAQGYEGNVLALPDREAPMLAIAQFAKRLQHPAHVLQRLVGLDFPVSDETTVVAT